MLSHKQVNFLWIKSFTFINAREQTWTLLIKTALMLFEHSIWRPVQVKTCSGSMLRSLGFSAQEIACYWIHCDLNHFC